MTTPRFYYETVNKSLVEAGRNAVVPVFDRIAQQVDNVFHIGEFFEVAEKLGQKQTFRIVKGPSRGYLLATTGQTRNQLTIKRTLKAHLRSGHRDG